MIHSGKFYLLGLIIALVVCDPVFAGKDIEALSEKPFLKTIGEAQALDVVPILKNARVENGFGVWSQTILIPDASFLKVRLVDVDISKGDELVLYASDGRIIETITGLGPKDMGTFWSLSAPGEAMYIEFRFLNDYRKLPFTIDRVIVGNPGAFGTMQPAYTESICPSEDFDDAFCSQANTGKWDNVLGSVGVMSVGGNATTALFCSGSNIAPSNLVLTNQHCIETQATCDNAEFVFNYYRTGCNDSSPTSAWVSYRCDTVLATEPFVNCDAGPGDLDFALTTVIGDPAATFGWVTPDSTPLTSGEEIYIVQHPAGRPHEITSGSGADVGVDGSVLRYYNTLDTEGGSSGSPIFRAADNKLVGLHHCGGCSSAGVGNRGMLMSDILPLINEFLCDETGKATFAGIQNLVQFSGNGDAILDRGETWQFTPLVRNTCATTVTGVNASFAINAGSAMPVTLLDTTAAFGDIVEGATVPASSPIRFEVDGSAQCGADVIIDLVDLTATNGGPFGGQAAIVEKRVGSQTTVFSENFDGGLVGWTVVDGGTGTGAAATWTTANPGARVLALSTPFAIVDSDNAGAGITQDEQLISPVFDGSGYVKLLLKFAHDFKYYAQGQAEQADVQVRSGATGGSWTTIANYSGGNSSGTVEIDISAYADTDMQLRFHYYNGLYEWWWAVDDIEVNGVFCIETCNSKFISDDVIVGPQTIQACNDLTVGPNVTISDDVGLYAGANVTFIGELSAGEETDVNTCGQNLCSTGPALDSNCMPWVSTICANDSSCCDTAWSAACVDALTSELGLSCDP